MAHTASTVMPCSLLSMLAAVNKNVPKIYNHFSYGENQSWLVLRSASVLLTDEELLVLIDELLVLTEDELLVL